MYVFVLESLRNENLKTGEILHNSLANAGIPSNFRTFQNKDELMDLLDIIFKATIEENLKPFIHFDCHGNSKGIAAVNLSQKEEFIPWAFIRDKFIPIYKASAGQSVICLSACEGFSASAMVATGKPCPYYYIVGSFRKIPSRKSLEAFLEFYQKIWQDNNIWETAVAINNSAIYKDLEFMAVNRDTIWDLLRKGYLNDLSSPGYLAMRKASLLKQLKTSKEKLTADQQMFIDKAFTKEWQENKLNEYQRIFFS